ncbi:MAG: hypothetical protein V7K97_16305 [Nostoc sp.]|uniref:hypothetical protein n=1 Tax=Nostoc sp. TaxID=1180 RepID=UPI002FF4A18D
MSAFLLFTFALFGQQPNRQTPENLYNREIIEVHDPQSLSLGWAWVYVMAIEQVQQLGGILQPNDWWTGSCFNHKVQL